MRKEKGREKVRELGLVLAAFEAAAWSVSSPVKYVREYERPSICRLSVRLPVPLPPKAGHRAPSTNQPSGYPLSLSLSPFLCRFNLTRIGLPCTHPRNHSYGFTSVVDNRTRLPRNFCTARTCFSCRQTCPSISRKSSPRKLGATLWKLGSRGRLGKSTLLATIVRAKNLNGSRFSIGL